MKLSELMILECWPQLTSAASHGQPLRISRRLGVTHAEAKDIAAAIRAHLRGDEAIDVDLPDAADLPVSADDEDEAQAARDEIARLRRSVRANRRDRYEHRRIRETAFELAAVPCSPPAWTQSTRAVSGSAGVPTLMLSDLHWGEVVRPAEVWSLNEYDVSVARLRLRRVVDSAVDLLRSHIVSPGGYPGIVLALGGDMVSGGIHPELLVTDEMTPIEAVVDLRAHLVAAIDRLVSEFGRVYVPCVDGNHDRSTMKAHKKRRVANSYGWQLYCLLEAHYRDDDRVTVQVSEETDILYTVAGVRYLLTHGDSLGVRGGDGIIGALGPIMRGRHKMASASGAVGRSFDVLIMGHWHQYVALRNVRVNGTLKGYDEYARAQRFAYEPPSQSLWITHPLHGVTISMPVLADEPRAATGGDTVM